MWDFIHGKVGCIFGAKRAAKVRKMPTKEEKNRETGGKMGKKSSKSGKMPKKQEKTSCRNEGRGHQELKKLPMPDMS